MKRTLMVAASFAAFVVPAAAPLAVMAQEADPGQPIFRNHQDIRDARAREDRQEQRQERREERREERQEPRPTQVQPTRDPSQPVFRNHQDIRDARAREDRQERREDRQERREPRPPQVQPPRDPNQPLFRNHQDIRDARAREEGRDPEQERRDRRNDRSDRYDHRPDYRDDRRHRDFRQRFNGDHWRRDWNRRHGSDWWRSDRRFRDYSGLRIGFYFAPGYGYYNVPRNYWNQTWRVGSYLPSIFWRYQLNDWRTYGLGYPPRGTQWVLVDNHIYLIDEYDGYIIDVIYDAWRW